MARGPIQGKQPSGNAGNLKNPGVGKGSPRATPMAGKMEPKVPRAKTAPLAGKF